MNNEDPISVKYVLEPDLSRIEEDQVVGLEDLPLVVTVRLNFNDFEDHNSFPNYWNIQIEKVVEAPYDEQQERKRNKNGGNGNGHGFREEIELTTQEFASFESPFTDMETIIGEVSEWLAGIGIEDYIPDTIELMESSYRDIFAE